MILPLQKSKIANLLVYLAANVQGLTITKALKLFYIVDENAVKEIGSPLTWLEYKAWKFGPVAEDIFFDLENRKDFLMEYVEVSKKVNSYSNYAEVVITPKVAFDDSEFSDYEIELIDRVIEKYGKKQAKTLVDMLHSENTLWHQIVSDNKLEESFAIYSNRSNYTIELSKLISDNPNKIAAYKVAWESLALQNQLVAYES